jgi:hypothetical protein
LGRTISSLLGNITSHFDIPLGLNLLIINESIVVPSIDMQSGGKKGFVD